jgi:hypothetical protein
MGLLYNLFMIKVKIGCCKNSGIKHFGVEL